MEREKFGVMSSEFGAIRKDFFILTFERSFEFSILNFELTQTS